MVFDWFIWWCSLCDNVFFFFFLVYGFWWPWIFCLVWHYWLDISLIDCPFFIPWWQKGREVFGIKFFVNFDLMLIYQVSVWNDILLNGYFNVINCKFWIWMVRLKFWTHFNISMWVMSLFECFMLHSKFVQEVFYRDWCADMDMKCPDMMSSRESLSLGLTGQINRRPLSS